MSNHISKEMKRFNHLLGELDAVYHEMALKLGLSDSVMRILYTIYNNGKADCPLQDICRSCGLPKQTVNSALRKLEGEGILYLKPAGPKNKNVRLTEEGLLLAEQTAGRILHAEDDILSSWPKEDVEKYLALTEDFLYALAEKSKNL